MEAIAAPVVGQELLEAQLMLLERQLAAISAVVDLIEADFRRLLGGGDGDVAEAQ